MSEAKEETTKKSGTSKIKFLVIFVIILLVAVAGASSYMFYQAQQKVVELSTMKGQQALAQKEVDMLLSEVKRHMVLPEKEKPTVATVTDAKSLKKNQPFFEKAENGDKVIVYVGAKKAIIYNPTKDIIVNVGFVAVDQGNAQVAGANAQNITVEVRNGTATSGLGQKVSTSLKNAGMTVQKVGDAKKKDYDKTQLVDLGKISDKKIVSSVAQALNATLTEELPEGESTSTADILVIVGSDQDSP